MAKEKKTLAEVTKDINKKFGEGTVMQMGKGKPIRKVKTIPTGVYSVDRIIGGGFRAGSIIELFGNAGSGKTTLALMTVAQEQAKGHTCVYIDVEHAFNMEYAQSLGVDMTKLYFSQPDSAEDAFTIINDFASTGEVSMIVLDSIAALMPKTEYESEPGKTQIGSLSRFMSNALRQVLPSIQKTDTTVVMINQTRTMIGVSYGDPITTPGGNAPKFYSSQRIQMDTSSAIKDPAGNIVGRVVRFKTLKNKIANPYMKTTVNFMYGKGFDKIRDIFSYAIMSGIIVREKTTYLFDGQKLAVGELNAFEKIKEAPEILEKIIKKLDESDGSIISLSEENE